jgi:hypothetical protein
MAQVAADHVSGGGVGEQHDHSARVVARQQIGKPVAVEIPGRQTVHVEASVVTDCRPERPRAVAVQDAHLLRYLARGGNVGEAVGVQVRQSRRVALAEHGVTADLREPAGAVPLVDPDR